MYPARMRQGKRPCLPYPLPYPSRKCFILEPTSGLPCGLVQRTLSWTFPVYVSLDLGPTASHFTASTLFRRHLPLALDQHAPPLAALFPECRLLALSASSLSRPHLGPLLAAPPHYDDRSLPCLFFPASAFLLTAPCSIALIPTPEPTTPVHLL